MYQQRLAELFILYEKGTASNEQWKEFMRIIKGRKYNQFLKNKIDFSIRSNHPPTNIPIERAQKILNHILTFEKHTAELLPFNKKKWYWSAAGILFLLATFSLIWISSSSEKSIDIAKQASQTKEIGVLGTKKFIRLPDGSSVILNVGSSIEYPEEFTNNKRVVKLNGEAYFDIKHDASSPFIVYVGKIKTTVLGTAFNVRTDSECGKVYVTVIKGRVKVGDDEKEYGIITPNEQMSINITNFSFKKESFNSDLAIEWKKEYLLLEDVSLN
jgi:transmembrane sensor